MPVMRGYDGRERWIEAKQMYLPKGGEKFSFKLRWFWYVMAGMGVCFYGVVQSQYNPNSIWGRIYYKVVNFEFSLGKKESAEDYDEGKKKFNPDMVNDGLRGKF